MLPGQDTAAVVGVAGVLVGLEEEVVATPAGTEDVEPTNVSVVPAEVDVEPPGDDVLVEAATALVGVNTLCVVVAAVVGMLYPTCLAQSYPVAP